MRGFGVSVGVVTLFIITGIVMLSYWSWFIVPIFGMRPITFWEAMGLAACIGLFQQYNPNDKRPPLERVIDGIIIGLFMLAWGWFIHGFAYGF